MLGFTEPVGLCVGSLMSQILPIECLLCPFILSVSEMLLVITAVYKLQIQARKNVAKK